MHFPIQPIQDRLIVLNDRRVMTEAAGIIAIEEEARDDYEILAVGPGKRLVSGLRRYPQVSVGERAVFHEWRGQHFDYDHMRLTVLAEDDLIGVIDREGKFRPLNNLLICEQLPTERKVGMILLPSVTDDRDEAIIKIVGPGKINATGEMEYSTLSVGDRVLYHKRLGMHFRLFGQPLVAIEERHVFCVVDTDLYVTDDRAEEGLRLPV